MRSRGQPGGPVLGSARGAGSGLGILAEYRAGAGRGSVPGPGTVIVDGQPVGADVGLSKKDEL
jgi:hypothetical protein